MGAFSGPEINESGLVLALDAANQKSLNIPSQSDHGYADWYCYITGTATYSIINSTGGIIYERNGSTVTSLVTATGPQRGTISVTAGRFYYGSVPINLVVEDQHHWIAPLTMVGTQFWNIAARAAVTPSIYYIFSPYQTATVNFYDGVATGLAGTPTSTTTISAGTVGTFTSSTNNNHWISSNVPVLAGATQNGVDKTILSPMSTYVYQRFQNYLNTTNNTTPTTNNSYVTYDSTYKVMNMNIADGAGGDCAQGLGLEYLSDTYSWGNVVSDYTMVFPYNGTFTASYWSGTAWIVWDTHTITTGSITNPPRVTRDGTNGPGVEASAIQGAAANMASGATLWKWEGNSPFYLCINDSVDDEFSVLGWNSSTQNTPRSGNTITDISGRGNNGTLLNGPVYVKDNRGSLSFNGSNYITSFPSQLSGTGSNTVNVWFRVLTTSRSGLCGTRANIVPTGWVLTVNRTSPGNLTYFHTGGSELQVTAGIVTNTWYCATSTYDASISTVTLYLNGSQIGSPQSSFSSMGSSTFNGSIGAEDESFGNKFSGNIANISLYNRALSASEIQKNYIATKSRYGL